MIDYTTILVLAGVLVMLLVLIFDKMRPGFTLFSGAILFTVFGVITPRELLDGFSSKEMITIAMLFLIGEGISQSGSLTLLIRHILPRRKRRVGGMLLRILPVVTVISSFLNNTAVVIIFAPIVKRWAERIGAPATKFLIPLSYATILGGLCTLIGTSTNMVINGLMIEGGYRGFTMFEIGKVGGVIAVIGLIYIVLFANRLLPNEPNVSQEDSEEENLVEVILMARFPGIGKSLKEFNFERHYGGAKVVSIIRNGVRIDKSFENHPLSEGDTLRIEADEVFVATWRDSSAFHIVSYSDNIEPDEVSSAPYKRRRRWLGLLLLIVMVTGSVFGERWGPLGESGVVLDIFLMAAMVMVVMALTQLFPVRRYTKYIVWDILIAIAAAFAISRAMSNSGINDIIASWIISMTHNLGSYGVLALLFLVTMLLTELITNNAAVAVAFPVAVALSNQLGIDPKPLFATICIAASASFSSPVGYQTNLIVQGVGGYRFKDYVRIGIWLNLITFIVSVLLIPIIWPF